MLGGRAKFLRKYRSLVTWSAPLFGRANIFQGLDLPGRAGPISPCRMSLPTLQNVTAYTTDYAKARASQNASERAVRARNYDFTKSAPISDSDEIAPRQPSRPDRGLSSPPR